MMVSFYAADGWVPPGILKIGCTLALASLLFVSPRFRVFTLAVFGSTAILQAIFERISGSVLSASLLRAAWTEREFADEAFLSFLPEALLCATVGVLVIASIHRALQAARADHGRWRLGLGTVVALLGVALVCGHLGRPADVPPPLRIVAVLAEPPPVPPPPWAPPELTPRRPAAARHLLLIVDESVRGDHLSINGYARPTTETLDGIINFGVASAGANCSAASNELLQSGVTPEQLSRGVDARQNLFAYARRAGFHTIHIDGQQRDRGMPPDIDERISIPAEHPEMETSAVDQEIAARLAAILRRDTPSFIYVNKYGAHYHYEGAYPADARMFTPTLPRRLPSFGSTRLTNSYDNAVHHAVETFFQVLSPSLQDRDVLVFYTSDHGESLTQRGAHCVAYAPPSEQAAVPLFVVSPQSTQAALQLARSARLHRDRQSHFQLFPTLLWTMGYERSEVAARFGADLLEAPDRPRYFVSGDLRDRRGRYLNRFDGP